jgi:hypothetical protein
MHALDSERVGNTIPTVPASGSGRADAEERLAWIRAAIVGEDAAVVRLGPHRRDLITGFA